LSFDLQHLYDEEEERIELIIILEDVLISLPIISDDQVGVAFLKAFDHRISFKT
jgi:hypothetical protein